MLEALLGGLAGVVLGSLFVFWVEQRRVKADAAVQAITWMSETYRHLEVRTVQLKFECQGPRELIRRDHIEEANQELRLRQLEDVLRARLAIVFGDGEEVRLINAFQEVLRAYVQDIWAVKDKETWEAYQKQATLHDKALEQARGALEAHLVESARFPWFLRRW
jgi:hypothetical protein